MNGAPPHAETQHVIVNNMFHLSVDIVLKLSDIKISL